MRPVLKILPLLGVGGLTLALFRAATAFRDRTREIIARLECSPASELTPVPLPAIVQSYLERTAGRQSAPRAVWLRQIKETRSAPEARWRPFTAKQVISINRPGFAWLARVPAMLAAVGSYPRLLCRWRGFARSATLRLITADASSGTGDQQGGS